MLKRNVAHCIPTTQLEREEGREREGGEGGRGGREGEGGGRERGALEVYFKVYVCTCTCRYNVHVHVQSTDILSKFG